jgi:hypothetical protein
MFVANCPVVFLMAVVKTGSERFQKESHACSNDGLMSRQIEMPTSRTGFPSLIADSISYHSTYDPIRESSRFFNSMYLEEADIILQFGWGLGHGPEALRTRCKPSEASWFWSRMKSR